MLSPAVLLLVVLSAWNQLTLGQAFQSETGCSICPTVFFFALESARLCAYQQDRSQYYPCALNYIGLNSWSLYRCPGQSTFDEASQQCLVKVPINDEFDRLSSETSGMDGQIQRIARFFLAKPTANYNSMDLYPKESQYNRVTEDEDEQERSEGPFFIHLATSTGQWYLLVAWISPDEIR